MRRHRQLIAPAIMAFVAITACSEPTAPRNEPAGRHSTNAASATEISFEKWFTTSPAMIGNTSYGDGTFAGTILKRTAFDNGVIVQLEALYSISDPSGSHSFKALIEGTENLQTATAVLNGVVTEGWRVGAQVHVTFRIITPCALAVGPSVKNVCFQGNIRIQGGV
jgi:hypothetical protein